MTSDVEYVHPGQFTREKNVQKRSEINVRIVQQEIQILEALQVVFWFCVIVSVKCVNFCLTLVECSR